VSFFVLCVNVTCLMTVPARGIVCKRRKEICYWPCRGGTPIHHRHPPQKEEGAIRGQEGSNHLDVALRSACIPSIRLGVVAVVVAPAQSHMGCAPFHLQHVDFLNMWRTTHGHQSISSKG